MSLANSVTRDLLVSIIIPINENHVFLGKCLESALEASDAGTEVLCVLDGPTEELRDYMRSASELDSRLRVIESPGEGLADARNSGLEASHGDFFVFLDSDDMLKPGAIPYLRALMNSDLELDAVFFGARTIFEGTKMFLRYPHLKLQYFRQRQQLGVLNPKDFFIQAAAKKTWISSACLFLGRKSMVDQFNIRFRSGHLMEDHRFTVEMVLSARKIRVCRERLYIRRVRGGSLTTGNDSAGKSRGYFAAATDLSRLAQRNSNDPSLEEHLNTYSKELFQAGSKSQPRRAHTRQMELVLKSWLRFLAEAFRLAFRVTIPRRGPRF